MDERYEWEQLIKLARDMGISIDEVRDFLNNYKKGSDAQ